MKNQRQNRTSKADSNSALAAPSKRGRRAKVPKASAIEGLEQINLHAAGIDVGAAQNFVCVPTPAVKSDQSNVRSFGAFTQN